MKVRLNLATSPLENTRRFVVFSTVIGSVGLLAMLLLSWNVYSMRRSNTAIRLEQAQMESDMQVLRRHRADLEAFSIVPKPFSAGIFPLFSMA